ncbi:TPA: Wzy polymerase domain-containing protein [Kluyvera georgiana]|uniref:Lipid A core-O-antigen ligase n=1 Tax=Kluyvera georgiana ATCC 51603 TaxID=1354264 RepID=A0A1B7JZY3_9ENTR|nr:Wzy polymerase domain-containing protein [Kluyvera georgiana]OAT53461.1 lipid A core-O-antigen ligase [Kluyvera georgiana ATCC 51603]
MASDKRKLARRASWMIVGLLAIIYLGAMHAVIPNMGGSGSELPTTLWVWLIMLVVLGVGWPGLLSTGIVLPPGMIPMLAGALLMTLPLAWCPHQTWLLDALPRFAGLWVGMLLLVLFAQCRFNVQQQQTLLYLVAAAALMQTAYSLAGLHWRGVLPEFEQQILAANPGNVGVFQQRNVTASFLACGGAIWLFLLGSARFRLARRRLEALRLASACVALVAIFSALTEIGSRIGWLSALCVYTGMVGLHWRLVTPVKRLAMLFAPLVGVATGALAMPDSLLDVLNAHHGSNLQRWMILRETWSMIVLHPWRGWGDGGFLWSFSHFIADRPHPIDNGRLVIPHPHNEILYWWVEGGMVALLGLACEIYAGMVIFLGAKRRRSLALLCCILPLLLHSQVEYPFYQSAVHWLLLVMLTGMAAGYRQSAHKTTHPALPLLSAGVVVVCLALSGVVALTLRQQNLLTGFERHPQRYEVEVLAMRESGLGIARVRQDRALAQIVRYQSTGDRAALTEFIRQGNDWLTTWVDADMYDNLINVNLFLGTTFAGKTLKTEAARIFTEDARFDHH